MDKLKLKLYLTTATYSILFYLVLTNLKSISGTFSNLLGVLTPIIYGFVIAYLLKTPYNIFYSKVYNFRKVPSDSSLHKFRKPLSLTSVYILFFFIIFIISSIIVPQLVVSVNTLITNSPQYSKSLEGFINNLLDSVNLHYDFWGQFKNLWTDFFQTFGKFITTGIPKLLDVALGITSSVSNIVLGFVISIYMLSSKDKSSMQAKKLLVAFLPEKHVIRILNVTALTDKTFSGFISGQLTDAFIVGILSFISLSLLNFPYALLISVILGITNIIPIFGPIIGAIPSTFIILMVDPIKAFWFIVFIIVLQQIDGNIICPRIIGNSIGLSGLWVMFAILLGGGLFGLVGMLIGVPTFAVVYTLVKHCTYSNLKGKQAILNSLQNNKSK